MSHRPPHDPAGLLDRLASAVGDGVGAGAVFGPPVTGDGVTVIPVARTRFGFGGGGGPSPDGLGEGAGGGDGGSSRPAGVIVIRGDRVRFRRFPNPLAFVAGALVLALAAALVARIRGCGACRRRGEQDADAGEPGAAP